MDLLAAHTLVVEQPWSAGKILLRTRYHADVYDKRDGHLATVGERSTSRLARPVRLTHLSGNTPFKLTVNRPDGVTLLTVDKGISVLRPRIRVSGMDGHELGSIERDDRKSYPITDRTGATIGAFDFPSGRFTAADGTEVATMEHRVIARRAGRRVGRIVLHVHPNASGPLRVLVIATVLALDVVRGNGTALDNAILWN
ncbi:hypothetical protein [Kibdelosporangium phytohabitans]|uniref:Uncharacterized protein n=1 Tax=Kibdelosporangium phytohabitans TaxID=860235 RepID=A0A0N9I5Z2_9PSEU|nr:hypothetical protein [Kibdelosporangium phytohabitans]ALG10004.1 hypothetical protein AOZ06_26655 [Kibdelosporangium phytohabitans]MBE1468575.1 hypothetical protein [Kibdelosporangium phytohabitans]